MDIDWNALTLPQHQAVLAALTQMHQEVISRVRIKDGHDNAALFAVAVEVNKAMHAGNDDLARRDHSMSPVTNCDCGVCP